MSTTQIQPRVRWGSVPLGAASCTAPRPKAAKAEKACSWMAGAAFNSGASDTARSPHAAFARNRAARAAADSGPRPSKRNLVVHVAALAGARQGRLLLARRGAGGAEIILVGAELAAGAIPGPVEHGELRIEILQHHLGGVFVLARLVLPFARLQLALEIDLRALLQILLGDPAKPLVEDDHAVPFGLLAALAGRLVAPGVRRRHAQIRDRPAVLRAPDLGIFAEIADQDHLVHATGHDALLLLAHVVRGSLIPSPRLRRRFHLRHHAFPQQDNAGACLWARSLFVLASTPGPYNAFGEDFLPSPDLLRCGRAVLQGEKYEADDRNQDIAVKNDAGIAGGEIVRRDHLIDVTAGRAP